MMTPETILRLTFIAVTIVGFSVFASNWKRSANQAFLFLTLTVSGWLGSLQEAFSSHQTERAENWIRIASIIGAFAPVAISMLRVSIAHSDKSVRRLTFQLRYWFIAYGLVTLYCATPYYLTGADIPANGLPNAHYGTLKYGYPIYMLGGFLLALFGVAKDIKRTRDAVRAEMEYLFAGVCCFFGAGIFACVVPLIVHNSQIVGIAPFWFLLMSLLIAYGIATKNILTVGTLFRRSLSYILLFLYLGLVYSAVWLGVSTIMARYSLNPIPSAPILATIIVALSLGKAQSILQIFIQKLFLNLHQLDLRHTLREVEGLFSRVTTTDELLRMFLPLIGRAAGTDLVIVSLFNDSAPEGQIWSTKPEQLGYQPTPALSILKTASSPLIPSNRRAARVADDPDSQASDLIASLHGALAVGIAKGDERIGAVILGEKRSGRTYDREEQETLRLLSNRLAVALENSDLYTEQQRSRQYLESLLKELTSGVIACGADRNVTVCNREAARLIARPLADIVGTPVNALPPLLAESLNSTLEQGVRVYDRNALLVSGDEAVPISLSGQIFPGGAFLVFSDLTEVKKLEEQLRRSDRLAVLGTLAAGLVHEIRNPLAPIKTYAELVPERRDDPAFINRFIQIVGDHISQIERLINQLLSFSRRQNPVRKELQCHAVLTDTLALLQHDLASKGISLETRFIATDDLIFADRQQFEQVILNTVRNAGEAMPKGGNLSISTKNGGDTIEIEIADRGDGIPDDVLSTIFDPFVTTKETGTGLGLSIVYGIIEEHSGSIQIFNREDGATVHISWPLSRARASAA
jgi:signal transduction histidine kinase